jgi:hypothetical protein
VIAFPGDRGTSVPSLRATGVAGLGEQAYPAQDAPPSCLDSRDRVRVTQRPPKVISQDEITGYAYRPVWDVIQRELVSAGFTQAEGAERLLAWRLA